MLVTMFNAISLGAAFGYMALRASIDDDAERARATTRHAICRLFHPVPHPYYDFLLRAPHKGSYFNRMIASRYLSDDVVWFDFRDICEGPRSQRDYIEIAREYGSVIVSGVPVFDSTREDAARQARQIGKPSRT